MVSFACFDGDFASRIESRQAAGGWEGALWGSELPGRGVPCSATGSEGKEEQSAAFAMAIISNRVPSDCVYTIPSFMRCFNSFD